MGVDAAVAPTNTVSFVMHEPQSTGIATDVATGISIRMVKEWDIKRGDRFTIEGKFALNPVTRQPTEFLQQFEVTDVVNGVARIYPGGAWYGNG